MLGGADTFTIFTILEIVSLNTIYNFGSKRCNKYFGVLCFGKSSKCVDKNLIILQFREPENKRPWANNYQ